MAGNLILLRVTDPEQVQKDLESQGVPVHAWQYDPATQRMEVFVQGPVDTAQRVALSFGHAPQYITFRGSL